VSTHDGSGRRFIGITPERGARLPHCPTTITYLRSLGATASLSRPSAPQGWSEAESHDWVAASRRLAVVMAGVVPSVPFRSGICGRETGCGRSRPVRDPQAVKAARASDPPEEWNCFSSGRRSRLCHPSACNPSPRFCSRLTVTAISASSRLLSHERRPRRWDQLASSVREGRSSRWSWCGVAPASDSGGRAGRLKTSLRCTPALRGLDPPSASP
jgi:hypothetical protein